MTTKDSINIRFGGIYIELVKVMECMQKIMSLMEEVEGIMEEEKPEKKGGCECI